MDSRDYLTIQIDFQITSSVSHSNHTWPWLVDHISNRKLKPNADSNEIGSRPNCTLLNSNRLGVPPRSFNLSQLVVFLNRLS